MTAFIENLSMDDHAYLRCDHRDCTWQMVADDEDLLALVTEYYLHESGEHDD